MRPITNPLLQQNNNNNYPCLSGGPGPPGTPGSLKLKFSHPGLSQTSLSGRAELGLPGLPLIRGLRAWALCSRSRLRPGAPLRPAPRPSDIHLSAEWGLAPGIGALVATLQNEGSSRTQTQSLFLRTGHTPSTPPPQGTLRGWLCNRNGGAPTQPTNKGVPTQPVHTRGAQCGHQANSRSRERTGRRWRKPGNFTAGEEKVQKRHPQKEQPKERQAGEQEPREENKVRHGGGQELQEVLGVKQFRVEEPRDHDKTENISEKLRTRSAKEPKSSEENTQPISSENQESRQPRLTEQRKEESKDEKETEKLREENRARSAEEPEPRSKLLREKPNQEGSRRSFKDEESREQLRKKKQTEELRKNGQTEEFAEKEKTEELSEKQQTEELGEKEQTEELREREQTEELGEKEPREKLGVKDETEELREKEQTEEFKKKKPTEELREKEPAEEFAEKEKTKGLREKEPTEEQTQQLGEKEQIGEEVRMRYTEGQGEPEIFRHQGAREENARLRCAEGQKSIAELVEGDLREKTLENAKVILDESRVEVRQEDHNEEMKIPIRDFREKTEGDNMNDKVGERVAREQESREKAMEAFIEKEINRDVIEEEAGGDVGEMATRQEHEQDSRCVHGLFLQDEPGGQSLVKTVSEENFLELQANVFSSEENCISAPQISTSTITNHLHNLFTSNHHSQNSSTINNDLKNLSKTHSNLQNLSTTNNHRQNISTNNNNLQNLFTTNNHLQILSRKVSLETVMDGFSLREQTVDAEGLGDAQGLGDAGGLVPLRDYSLGDSAYGLSSAPPGGSTSSGEDWTEGTRPGEDCRRNTQDRGWFTGPQRDSSLDSDLEDPEEFGGFVQAPSVCSSDVDQRWSCGAGAGGSSRSEVTWAAFPEEGGEPEEGGGQWWPLSSDDDTAGAPHSSVSTFTSAFPSPLDPPSSPDSVPTLMQLLRMRATEGGPDQRLLEPFHDLNKLIEQRHRGLTAETGERLRRSLELPRPQHLTPPQQEIRSRRPQRRSSLGQPGPL